MKLLLVNLNAIVETLSGNTLAQHCRDQKILNLADRAIADYHSQGWTIYVLTTSEETASKSFTVPYGISFCQYTLMLFPELSGVYICTDLEGNDLYLVDREGHCYWNRKQCSYHGNFRNSGAISVALSKIKGHCTSALYVSFSNQGEAIANEAGIDYLQADYWLEPYQQVKTPVYT